jgi:hypothetical protein
MKTIEEIDVNVILSEEDFCTMFTQVSLNEEEKHEVKTSYYNMYKLFIESEVTPILSWVAIRNLFVQNNPRFLIKS